jgi:hypothetical protein
MHMNAIWDKVSILICLINAPEALFSIFIYIYIGSGGDIDFIEFGKKINLTKNLSFALN